MYALCNITHIDIVCWIYKVIDELKREMNNENRTENTSTLSSSSNFYFKEIHFFCDCWLPFGRIVFRCGFTAKNTKFEFMIN